LLKVGKGHNTIKTKGLMNFWSEHKRQTLTGKTNAFLNAAHNCDEGTCIYFFCYPGLYRLCLLPNPIPKCIYE